MADEDVYVPPIHLDRCPYCRSTLIIRHVKVDQTADAGNIGLAYKARFLLQIIEPLFADLCDNCGTVLRFFVDKPRRQWVLK